MLRALNHEIEQKSNNINMAIAAKQEQRNRSELERQLKKVSSKFGIYKFLVFSEC
jgi:hypothetical protein